VNEDPPGPLPVVFRPTRTRVVLLTVGVATAVTFTTVAFAVPEPWTVADRVVMTVTGLAVLAILLLLSRPKVAADEDGLTVVNLTTSRRLAWAQVLGVNLRSGDPWVYLDLADGTSMAAMGIQPGNGKRRAARDAGRLRALVEARGTGDPQAG
jgi:hypothetical protein